MAELPIIDGFRILEELGSGTLTTVYAAVEESLGRKVALKVLRSTIASTSPFAQQLEREARVLSGLSHPNIGLLYGFTKSEPRTYLVIEYVDGFTLAEVLKKRPVLPPISVASIGAAAARGLGHAHAEGIIHRDVKPANVLIGRRGQVKIFDFGIAQRARSGDDLTSLSRLRLEDATSFGTPAYMAPEQILGENVDARSDLFSLGVVLYQLVCGARPFERDDDDTRPAAQRIRRDPPIPLHRRAPDVPPALERVIMRAIEKLPADRYPTAEAMAQDLEDIASARAGLLGDRRVIRALEHAGLVRAAEDEAPDASVRRKTVSVRGSILGLLAFGALVTGSGAVLQATAHRSGDVAGSAPLELLPASPGYLRVLATPWAEVWIDGQRADVTPFARAIPLAPGTHYVTLTHPHAPADKRTLTIVPGETRWLDVVMAVPELAPKGEGVRSVPMSEKSAQTGEKDKKR